MRTAGLSSVDVASGLSAGAGADVAWCCAIAPSAMTTRVGCLLLRRRTVLSVGRCRVTSIENTIQGRCLDRIGAKGGQACIWSEGTYRQGNNCVKTCKFVCTFYDLIPERLSREGSKGLKIRATSNVQGSEGREA